MQHDTTGALLTGLSMETQPPNGSNNISCGPIEYWHVLIGIELRGRADQHREE